MGGGSIIVRLIDLVFILLFAFIAISQFSNAQEIEVAKSTEASPYDQDSTKVVVVGVLKNGQYPIDDGQIVLPDSIRLYHYLAGEADRALQAGVPFGVRIRAAWDSPLHYAMTAAQICKALGLPKGLDVMKVPDK